MDFLGIEWFEDFVVLVNYVELDVFVELIGGDGGIVYDVVFIVLVCGIYVVMVNKVLIVVYGVSFVCKVEENGV